MALLDSAALNPSSDRAILDFIGVGFGPSNLALAVAAREIDAGRRGLFFERKPLFDWHPGLLFDSSRMQISFLKDLATLRNPASPFSFLQYTKAKGRLEHFVNLSEFHPTRLEYRDYLRWVAGAFADQVQYGSAVLKVTPTHPGADGRYQIFKVDVQCQDSGKVSSYLTRNVVYAAGGTPRYPANTNAAAPNVIHSCEFLQQFPPRFPQTGEAYALAVVGDGQSAGEILAHLHHSYPRAQIHLFISGYALRPADSSPFVNEAFFFSEMEAFHGSSDATRSLLRRELRNTNYGVVAPELIDQIYRADYQDSVKGVKRLFIHKLCKLAAIESDAQGVVVTVEDRLTGQTTSTRFDGVVLATGYERRLDPQIFSDLLPFIQTDDSGAMRLTEHYRVQTLPQLAGALYVQGYGESSHGMSDTLLSLLPFRSRDIFTEICRTADTPAIAPSDAGEGLPHKRLRDVAYPPKRHLEDDPRKLHDVLERCRFATLISASGDEPIVTHVPLILDRAKGRKGTLFGHMDRANPHVELLEGRPILAVFHGPNAYISPHVYQTNQLPTWNSITVHVRGTIRLLSTRDSLLRGLASICETDSRAGAYRLDLNHPAIDRILDFIVGFEIQIDEMVGRFKLSQDRSASDQRLAAFELARHSEAGERALIEQALGYPLEAEPSVSRPASSLNPAESDRAGDRCIHELFEAQVSRTPYAQAILFEAGSVSYGELNHQANQLAHHLRALGVGPETIVGLCLERSPQMLVALLGILKAGAAFTPIDPEFPQQRIAHMLNDTAAAVLLTQSRFKDRFSADRIHVVCMDTDWPQIAAAPADNPGLAVDPQNLAYCIYTSGSTGKPKAVAIPHRGLVNHVLHVKSALRHSAADRVLQFTAITADGSLQEIFTAWLSGAALVLPTEKAPSIRSFLQMLNRYRVSVVSVPTAYWHFWVGEMATSPAEWPESVRLVILGGEKVIPEKFRQWRELPCTRNVTWIQDYGPTETTVSCTTFEAATDDPATLSIGRPNSNMQIYILDAQGNPAPAGEPGELCIAGHGLARGYLNRPELTAEKFVPNPFAEPGTRLYRTGDLARYLPDGNLQFLGRRDEQVKILGHRIELGEIESALLRCEGVRQAIVLARESATGSKRLVAFLVAENFDENEARAHLSTLLPRAMMPADFLVMAELPSTPGGKVDRARLLSAAPAPAAPVLRDATDLEQAVSRLWTECAERPPQSVDEDLLLCGGDSLRALSFLNRVAALTGVEIAVADFFRERTIRALAASLEARALQSGLTIDSVDAPQCLVTRLTGGALQRSTRLRRHEARRQPASNAQQRLWFLDRLQQGAATYSVPLAYRITGDLSVERLDQCLTTIVALHEALRTVLVMTPDEGLWQEIAPPMEVRTARLQAASFAEAMTLAQTEASVPFDLTQPPMLRSICIHTAEQESLWLIVFHHAVCDAWTIAIFWRELIALYAEARELPALDFQYSDYTQWQREWLSSPQAAPHREFWRKQLAGELPPLQLGRRCVPDNVRSTGGAMEPCQIGNALARATRDTAERHGATEFVVVLSAFLATLHRFTRQDGIVVGVPVACRSFSETEGIVGYFTNTLPLRIVFSRRMRFCELIQQTSQALADALAHQELPFDQIVDALEADRHGSSNPIFQAMFVMQTTPLDGNQQLAGAQVEEIVVHSGTSKVDVTCSIRTTARGFDGELEYSTDVLSQTEASRFVQSFLGLLAAATQDPSAFVEELSMLTLAERDSLILAANSRFERYPDFRPLHVHFESQARAAEDAIAIRSGDTDITYGELNASANRLARHLTQAGLRQESLAGICMDRSAGMVIAVLATLKAGAGFVPIDPDFPIERIQAIGDDAHLQLIITHERYARRLESLQIPLMLDDAKRSRQDDSNPDIAISPENIAYVYYTSGSTGVPKGVILDHRGAMNRMEWLRRRYLLKPGDRLLHKTPLIFDLAIWEIFGPLMAGATILMADAKAESDVAHIGNLLSSPRTAFVYFVPSMLEAYLSFAQRRSYPDLRWIAVTGEAVPTRMLERFNQHFPLEFHNIYGQTETSELALWEGTRWEGATMVPIGRAIGIYRLYVLDSALNPVPPDVPGEIYVAGIGGLARGYQGLPALTAEKFIPNPYAVVPGERMYRTGDLARLSEDGLMEYVGRTDHQVKIRGCRVETSEVEAIVSRHPSVRACAVVVRNDASGSAQMLAYVAGDGVSVSELGAHVEKSLPRYMLPSAYIFVDELPLTPSGKLDRARLPAPRPYDFEARASHEAPQSQLEVQLATVWKRVLGLENVGRTDNFFSLGGNSLKSIQVIARLKDDFGVDVRVRDFFSSPTIDGLARIVERELIAFVASLSDEEVERRLGSRA